MIKSITCTALSVALQQLKKIVRKNEDEGRRTVVFCEDRLSLAAERTVCAEVEGTFLTSVYTFARFLSSECGKPENVLSAQGSAMAIRRIIEQNRQNLTLFKELTAPTAAQAVYDTIALLYSSRVSAENIAAAAAGGGTFGQKLKDIALIYGEYMKYLEKDPQKPLQDRNVYLKRLSSVIENSPRVKGATVVMLGFQAFTQTTTECACAAFGAARDVIGLFIGGDEDIYVNEARFAFISAAKKYGGAEEVSEEGDLLIEADILRRSIFNPESIYGIPVKKRETPALSAGDDSTLYTPIKTKKVNIYEASDEEEELEFIAASIKRHVLDGGERYAKISVMLPDLKDSEQVLSRVFKKYRIPYYADRRIPLAEHPLSAFVFAWLGCVIAGCRPQDADAIISSPFFPAERVNKDIFRNYALRLAAYRGGAKREPKRDILEKFGYDYGVIEGVRQTFVKGCNLLDKMGIFGGLRAILREYKVAEKLKSLAEEFKDSYPVQAAFGARALEGVLQVLDEAESIAEGLSLTDTVKVLKSGFAAMEISLIPPKADAVFVGDIAATANTGSNIVFAARLSGDVPGASSDTALLTDREMALLDDCLKGEDLTVAPKIRQVNLRKRETVALNICAFRRYLYLTYPTRLKGEENGVSEIISYVKNVFTTEEGQKSGKLLEPAVIKDKIATGVTVPYYASEKLPAIKQLLKLKDKPEALAAVYKTLCERGYREEADAALKNSVHGSISCGEKLYLSGNSISPTALETYFSCPYKGFMKEGLKVQERQERAVQSTDTGLFIHSVLEDLAKEINGISDISAFNRRAEELAGAKLKVPPYSALLDVKSGQYKAGELLAEAVKIAAGMFEQLKNSDFTVLDRESSCQLTLTPKIKLYGRIDRVDECDGMVRIIDYKTGDIHGKPAEYYSGTSLQLPLYLLAATQQKPKANSAEDGTEENKKRAVGAYYFPASIKYAAEKDGVFRLEGFMDGSEEVVSASDKTLQPGQKSEYFDAYLNGDKTDIAMEKEVFEEFLNYSLHVAKKGADEMISGNITPSPAAGGCTYCKFGGSCGFALGVDGEERKVSAIKCSEIAKIAKKEGGNV